MVPKIMPEQKNSQINIYPDKLKNVGKDTIRNCLLLFTSTTMVYYCFPIGKN